MSAQRTPDRTALPLAVLDQIDRICDRFEAAWEAGEPPRIEEVLGQIAEAYRPALLCDLLAAELNARRRLGEQPTPAEYAARCPEHAERISDVFLDLELCETPKDRARTNRCEPPACRHGRWRRTRRSCRLPATAGWLSHRKRAGPWWHGSRLPGVRREARRGGGLEDPEARPIPRPSSASSKSSGPWPTCLIPTWWRSMS